MYSVFHLMGLADLVADRFAFEFAPGPMLGWALRIERRDD